MQASALLVHLTCGCLNSAYTLMIVYSKLYHMTCTGQNGNKTLSANSVTGVTSSGRIGMYNCKCVLPKQPKQPNCANQTSIDQVIVFSQVFSRVLFFAAPGCQIWQTQSVDHRNPCYSEILIKSLCTTLYTTRYTGGCDAWLFDWLLL